MSSYLKLNSDDETFFKIPSLSWPIEVMNNFSIGVWCRLSSKSISNSLIYFYNESTSRGYKIIFNEETNGDLSLEFLFQSSTGIRTEKIQNIPLKIDEWQHFVFICDRGSSGANIYIDAVAMADTMNSGTTPTGVAFILDDCFIGFNPLNPSIGTNGNIDIDGLVYFDNFVLSPENIREIYNRGYGYKVDANHPLSSNIGFALNFDEASGGEVADYVSSDSFPITSNNIANVWGQGGVDSMKVNDLSLYLTSLEPDYEQLNYSQSIGGHISETLLYPQAVLNSSLGLYSTSISLLDETNLIGFSNVAIESEIISTEDISSTDVTIKERGINGVIGYYPSNTIVSGVLNPFNDSFNNHRKQYRCYAVKNTSSTETARRVGVYLRHVSKNDNTIIKLAIESPRNQGVSGISTSWTSSMLKDNSIVGLYEDNLFSGSYLTVLDSPYTNDKRRISSYDGATGTFVFSDAFPFIEDYTIYSSSLRYSVGTSPSQRVRTGVDEPLTTPYISEFFASPNRDNSIFLSDLNSDGSLLPGNIMYVWVEREIGKSSNEYIDNNFVLSIHFEN